MILVNLKAALVARQISQVELCSELKISESFLSKIILGQRVADRGLQERIARRLSADRAWLFDTPATIPPHRNIDHGPVPAPLTCSAKS